MHILIIMRNWGSTLVWIFHKSNTLAYQYTDFHFRIARVYVSWNISAQAKTLTNTWVIPNEKKYKYFYELWVKHEYWKSLLGILQVGVTNSNVPAQHGMKKLSALLAFYGGMHWSWR